MAGLGRRTHYRKHLTDSVLHDFPEPQEHERIAKVVATRGGNQFDILVSASTSSSSDSKDCAEREHELAILPTKFRKLVWVKRGDYVIVETGDTEEHQQQPDVDAEDDVLEQQRQQSTSECTGIRFMITHILYKEQIKHLRSAGLWPTHDPEFCDAGVGNSEDDEHKQQRVTCSDQQLQVASRKDDGIVYNNDFYDDGSDAGDDDLFVNTNRVAAIAVADSSDDEDSDDNEKSH